MTLVRIAGKELTQPMMLAATNWTGDGTGPKSCYHAQMLTGIVIGVVGTLAF